MSERRLVNLLEGQLNETDVSSSEVGEQREANHRYYAMQPMGNEQVGRSQYVSPDVLDSVEGKKALFAETFLSGRNVVKFLPNGPGDELEAEKRTAYVDRVFKRNKMYDKLRDSWHDAFVAKRCVFLVEWREQTELRYLDVEQATEVQVMALIQQQGDVVDYDGSGLQMEFMPTPMGVMPVASGTLIVEVDTSHVEVRLCQPERFFRDPNNTYIWQSAYATYEEDLTRGEVIDRGFDEEQVMGLSTDYRWRSEEEDSARKAHDSSWTRRRQHKRSDEQETVSYFTTYSWMRLDTEDFDLDLNFEPIGVQLYKIQWAHGEILRWPDGTHAISVAEEIPFFEWTEMKVSHAEHGMADADVMRPTQKTQSVLKRLVIDNNNMRNTSRYEAVYNAVKNPRDLLDNKIGGVVWSRAIGSVAPLATPELSPFTDSLMERLDRDGERRSGESRLARGMNQDAVRYQNSEGMIDKLTNAGNRRVMRAARDYAQTLLAPLSNYIYRIGARHDKKVMMVEAQGQMMPASPAMWEDRDQQVSVHTALTPEEGRRYAADLQSFDVAVRQDPEMAPLYGLSQRHAVWDEILDALGVSDSTRFLLRPDDPQVQQGMMQNQAVAQDQQQKQEFITMEQVRLADSQDKLSWQRLNLDATDKLRDFNQTQEKQEHDMEMDEEELELEKTQDRNVSIG